MPYTAPDVKDDKSSGQATITIGQLEEAGCLKLTPALKNQLEERQLKTLADIRARGGLTQIPGFDANDSLVKQLDGHAQLSILSTDLKVNDALIQKGITSIFDIAGFTRSEFVRAVNNQVDEAKAAQLYGQAQAQCRYLDDLVTTLRLNQANGPVALAIKGGSSAPQLAPVECEAGLSAVSPLAYLADLLEYTAKHVKGFHGLRGEYYNDENLTNCILARIDPEVDFNWGAGSPDPKINVDNFSVRWTGQIRPRFSETYIFTTATDDGVKLWVNGQPLINQWQPQATTSHQGTIKLEAGNNYELKMEYFEHLWDALAQLFWSSPSQPQEIVPTSQLFPGDSYLDSLIQTFYELLVTRQATEQQVCRVRLGIETLRGYLKNIPLNKQLSDILDAATSAYLRAAYNSMLTQIGTSAVELRLAKGATEAERQALAERLGLRLSEKKWGRGDLQFHVADGKELDTLTAVSAGEGRLDLFARSQGDILYHTCYDGCWHNWERLSKEREVVLGNPAAISWGQGRLDVFAHCQDTSGGHTGHYWYDPSNPPDWQSGPLGGQFHSILPIAISWGEGRIDLFNTGGPGHQLYHKWYDANTWYPQHEWESLGEWDGGYPAAVSWGARRIDLFAPKPDGVLHHKWYDGAWHDWESLGGAILGRPAVVSWGQNRLDLFALGLDRTLQYNWYDGAWHAWESLGGKFAGWPSAVSWGEGRIDVFAQGEDDALYHKWYDSHNDPDHPWHDWESWGEKIKGVPIAVSWDRGRIDVFAPGLDGTVLHKWYDGSWHDKLEKLLLNLTAPPANPQRLDEAALERLFGLVDTRRDPFSTGAKSCDADNQLSHWSLEGVIWNRNTDADGKVYVSLTKDTMSVTDVGLYRDQSRTDLVAMGKINDEERSVTLSAKNGSGLTGVFKFSNKPSSNHTIEIAAIPEFLCWRLAALRTLWQNQDHPTNSYSEKKLPIIDPDLMGPDDFRVPYPDSGRAFNLWKARRQAVDTILSDLAQKAEWPAMLSYDDLLNQQEVAALALKLQPGAELGEFGEELRQKLGLSAEAFRRLIEVLARWAGDLGRVEQVDRDDLISILAQACKLKRFESWIAVETGTGIILGAETFWSSLDEPQVSVWPPPDYLDQPLIDPDAVKVGELRAVQVGDKPSRDLWQQRADELDQLTASLKDLIANVNVSEMALLIARMTKTILELSESEVEINQEFDTLQGELQELREDKLAEFEAKLAARFYLTLNQFDDLMTIRAKTAVTIGVRPMAEEWTRVTSILKSAYKQKKRVAWKNDERTATGQNSIYWLLLKARLPKWRASLEERQRWLDAFKSNNSRPLIDPDLLSEVDFQPPLDNNKAYQQLWSARDAEIDDIEEQLQHCPAASNRPMDTFKAMLKLTELEAEEFNLLCKRRRAGEDIRGRLEQIGLSGSALARLEQFYALLGTSNILDDSEWVELRDILTGVRKQRLFARWRYQEREVGISLSQDYFKLDSGLPRSHLWRTTAWDHTAWVETLETRLAQEQAVGTSLRQAVEAAEEAALPILRAGLIEAAYRQCHPDETPPAPGEAQARWVTNTFMIDAQADLCQKTTRAQQAIETLQMLLWSARTGLLQDIHPELQLEADTFDQDWQWLGSYATWRAAMFAYLYPENILLPTLRRRQTPGFQALVDTLRISGRMAPQDAEAAVQIYWDYFVDICHLTINATATYYYDNLSTEKVILFATGGNSGRLYWSIYDTSNDLQYAQSVWKPVPHLEDIKVDKVIGATIYSLNASDKKIFLFLKANENGASTLNFLVCNPEANQSNDVIWSELKSLKVETEQWNALLALEMQANTPPGLFIWAFRFSLGELTENYFKFRQLNDEGTDWEAEKNSNEWVDATYVYGRDTYQLGQNPPFLVIHDSQNNGRLLMLSQNSNKTYSLFFSRDSVQKPYDWEFRDEVSSPNGSIRGVTLFQSERVLLAFGSGGTWRRYIIHLTNDEAYLRIQTYNGQNWSGILSSSNVNFSFPVNNAPTPKNSSYISFPDHEKFYLVRIQFTNPLNSPPIIGPSSIGLAPIVLPDLVSIVNLDGKNISHRKQIREIFEQNSGSLWSHWVYLDEVYYYVPLFVALNLSKNGYFIEALDWFRKICDYSRPAEERFTYPRLVPRKTAPYTTDDRDLEEWLKDPLDVHAIAANRDYPLTDVRFILLSLTRCLLAYADAEFTTDTVESLARARDLYLQALTLLDNDQVWSHRSDTMVAQPSSRPPRTLRDALQAYAEQTRQVQQVLLADPRIAATAQRAQAIALSQPLISTGNGAASKNGTSTLPPSTWVELGFLPVPKFCFPPNPILAALRLHAELNLYKLRTCRNIAGLQRQLDPYPGAVTLQPTQYRYQALVERAKQLANSAQQIEASFLLFLERRDAELYNLLKARQDVELTNAGVRLQELRIDEAESNLDLAQQQKQKVEFQVTYYTELLKNPLNTYEKQYIKALAGTRLAYEGAQGIVDDPILFYARAISISAFTPGVSVNLGAFAESRTAQYTNRAALESAKAAWFATEASFERREEEWKFQKSLVEQEVGICESQIQVAQDHKMVVNQEYTIAAIQSDNAEETVEFLDKKFTNFELYEWMGNIVGNIYRYFLQQATVVAKIAQIQLAFERQEPAMGIILNDYWMPPSEYYNSSDQQTPNRRGMTGSARLLQDITKLDQQAFLTDRRKLQLNKTISLAMLDPIAFQQFQETGVLLFATPMVLFDRDFPGHYLRLIKRVRTTVIALIPPIEGIKATLSTSGISRVVRGGDVFEVVNINREPESVALSSPLNATGVFELQEQPEMLLPFEGSGVDTTWEFRLPKAANPFDYRSIADVLVTFDYTALDSWDYRQQVIKELDRSISADRPFSFRHQFPDAWYDLHNPASNVTELKTTFITRREDFPPNVTELKIQHISLYFAQTGEQPFEVQVSRLHFTPQGAAGPVGGGATTENRLTSTRSGNAGSWTALIGRPPMGKWELALPNLDDLRSRFKNGEIEDILLVITFSGFTPEWPA